MKKYIVPEVEVAKFAVEDIITTSGNGSVSGDDQWSGGEET